MDEQWDDHDEAYDFTGDEVGTTTEQPEPSPAREPEKKDPKPVAKERKRKDTRVPAEVAARATTAEHETRAALDWLKHGKVATVKVVRDAVMPGSPGVAATDTGDVPGRFPLNGLEEAIRQRVGGGQYTAYAVDPDSGKSLPFPVSVSGKSKPIHPEDEEGDAGAFLGDPGLVGAPGPWVQPGQPVLMGYNGQGQPVYGPSPYGQLPPHLQPPPGYGGQGGYGPEPARPVIDSLRSRIKELEADLQQERRDHAATRATLEQERATAREKLHQAELQRVRDESAARFAALEARLSAPREDPLAPILKLQEADRQAQRELQREREKREEAAQARLEALLAKLGEKPAEGPMDKLLTTLITSMVEAKQENADPLKQVELLERLQALSSGKGDDEEEEPKTTVGKVAKEVLSMWNTPIRQPQLVAPPGYALVPQQQVAGALPGPGVQAVDPEVQKVEPYLQLVEQVAQHMRQQSYAQQAAQAVKAWAQQVGLAPLIAQVTAVAPATVAGYIGQEAQNPKIPDHRRQACAFVAQVFSSPEPANKTWVDAFWAELKK